MKPHEVHRMSDANPLTNPIDGKVLWSPVKSLWFTFHAMVAVIGGALTFRLDAMALSCGFTILTLALGHSVGLHRLLIHRSFECPLWLERVLVHLGTVVGMGGPFRILYMHDIRDWAQRHERCHAMFSQQNSVARDFLWQIHSEILLDHPPKFEIEPRVADDRFYQFMERTWMWQQLPWALLFAGVGGWAFVVWGISVRITVSLLGHWIVGYLAHNTGRRDWHLRDHAIQGYNVPCLSLLTMGESWHNNHHAFPESARLGLTDLQFDPGWWALSLLRRFGLVWNVCLPENLPFRPELVRLTASTPESNRHSALHCFARVLRNLPK